MGNNSQSRKWALVINNPLEAGLDHAAIAKLLLLFSPAYYCMADEIATTGTYHTHVFFYGLMKQNEAWQGPALPEEVWLAPARVHRQGEVNCTVSCAGIV